MSYPPPRYHGTTGEVSASYRPADNNPDVTFRNGNRVYYLATAASTEGNFGLYRWEMSPEPSGADAHFHRTFSESFYILSGIIRLYDGYEWCDAAPGEFHYVPPGGIHAFKNESGEPASMLLLFSPGAAREKYFETLADAAGQQAMTEEQRTEFFLRHDNHWI